jgi:large conductance mechanosensitive channel
MLEEFRDFIVRGNVVELAVAVIIGAAFGAVVTAFSSSFVTPLIALIGGKPDFGGLAFTISGTEFPYGLFLNALISLLIIAAIVFLLVVRPMNTVMERIQRADEPGSDAPSEDIVLLTEIRDLLRAERPGA